MSRLNEYQIGDRVHTLLKYHPWYKEGTVLGYIYFGGRTTHYHVLWDGRDEATEECLPKGVRV